MDTWEYGFLAKLIFLHLSIEHRLYSYERVNSVIYFSFLLLFIIFSISPHNTFIFLPKAYSAVSLLCFGSNFTNEESSFFCTKPHLFMKKMYISKGCADFCFAILVYYSFFFNFC